MKNFNKKGGISILGILILALIGILVLSYFKISIKSVVESPIGQENINYVGGGTRNLWDDYLAQPAHYLWQDVWVNIFWQGFINNMERIRDGQPTDFDNAAKNLQIPPTTGGIQ
jgi:hypothetical protein